MLDHVAAIERKYHGLIRKAINQHLRHTPGNRTRNRKPIEQPGPFTATWELRFGPDNCFRVFYEVDEIEHTVWILAIGFKMRERLFIGGEEIQS